MLSPNQIRQAEFDLQLRGYDRNQVDELLEAAAVALESTRNEAMTIERRFRAAAARVQELTAARAADPSQGAGEAAEQDQQAERMVLEDQIAQLEQRRAELDRQIAERAATLRADQERLRGVADSLRTLADQRFELDSGLDAEQRHQQAPDPPEVSASESPESPDSTSRGLQVEAPSVAAAQMTTAAGESLTQATSDPAAAPRTSPGASGVDEPGPNPR